MKPWGQAWSAYSNKKAGVIDSYGGLEAAKRLVKVLHEKEMMKQMLATLEMGLTAQGV